MSKKQKIKQILAGLVLIIGGIISAAITNDATAAVIVVPLGAVLMLTRERVLD